MIFPFPWQQAMWQQMHAVYAAGRLPHGLILGGPQGVGKLTFAGYLARFLMCLNNGAGQPCGQCKSCLLLDAESHPDVRIFTPEEDGRILKVDQVRDLNEFISKTPQQGRQKVAILHPAEAMNLNAANALLKTLEEPSADAILLLVSHMPSQLLPTIRSRCQIWSFATPPMDQVLPWLNQQADIDPDQAAYLLKIAKGAPLSALQLAKGDALQQRMDMLADLAAVLKRDKSPFEVAARWHKLDLAQVLSWMYQWCACMIAYQSSKDSAQIYDEGGRKMLEYVATKATGEDLYRLLDQLAEAIRGFRSHQNPNVQLLMESLLCRWLGLIARKDRR